MTPDIAAVLNVDLKLMLAIVPVSLAFVALVRWAVGDMQAADDYAIVWPRWSWPLLALVFALLIAMLASTAGDAPLTAALVAKNILTAIVATLVTMATVDVQARGTAAQAKARGVVEATTVALLDSRPSLTDADLRTIATLVDRAAAQRETQAGAP